MSTRKSSAKPAGLSQLNLNAARHQPYQADLYRLAECQDRGVSHWIPLFGWTPDASRTCPVARPTLDCQWLQQLHRVSPTHQRPRRRDSLG